MKPNHEEGSTALEALIAIAVISIAAVALVAGARNGLSVITKAESSARDSAKVLRIDDALRSAASRVRVPYWARGTELESDGQQVTIPWYEGLRGSALTISLGNETLTIAEGATSRVFPDVPGARLALVNNPAGAVSAIELRYASRRGEIRVLAPFGAAALMNGAKQ